MKISKDKREIGLNIVSKKIIETRKKVCKDFHKFREYYFKNYHKFPDADFHKELSSLLLRITANRGTKIAIAAPRDSAKSTIVSLEYVIYCICYKFEEFIVITSSTSDQAVDFLSHVKKELECNERLCRDFPEICETGEKPRPPRWTQKEISTRNGVKVIALSTGQQIRGRRHGSARPSLIILDDIETGETAQNPENFQKLEDWLTKSVLKAGTNRTNVVYVGTIHHYNSLLAKFTGSREYPGWHKKVYRSIISWSDHPELWQQWIGIFNYKEDYNGQEGAEASLRFFKDYKRRMLKGTEVLWAARKSYYDLMVMREEEGYYSFDSEMQNEPVNLVDCCFPIEMLFFWCNKFGSEEELLRILGTRGNYVMLGACDPSMGKLGARGDRSAIITAVKDLSDGKIYILHSDIARRLPDKIIEDILAYHKRYNYSAFAFETNQFQEFMASELQKRAIEADLPLTVHGIKSTSDKVARIQSLQPLIKSGCILFSKRDVTLLEEMKFFPKGRYDDGLDALQMLYEVSRGITVGGTGNPVSSFQLDSVPIRDCLRDVPDVRYQMMPNMYQNKRDKGDRFVPPGW